MEVITFSEKRDFRERNFPYEYFGDKPEREEGGFGSEDFLG
jgi:hypothetical protein